MRRSEENVNATYWYYRGIIILISSIQQWIQNRYLLDPFPLNCLDMCNWISVMIMSHQNFPTKFQSCSKLWLSISGKAMKISVIFFFYKTCLCVSLALPVGYYFKTQISCLSPVFEIVKFMLFIKDWIRRIIQFQNVVQEKNLNKKSSPLATLRP